MLLVNPPSREDFLKAPFVQLFNVVTDPHEDNNLAALYPQRVEAMVAMLQTQISQGRSKPGQKLKNDRNVLIHSRLPAWVRSQMK